MGYGAEVGEGGALGADGPLQPEDPGDGLKGTEQETWGIGFSPELSLLGAGAGSEKRAGAAGTAGRPGPPPLRGTFAVNHLIAGSGEESYF